MFRRLKCDIYLENDIYYIEADIPGYKKENIKITYKNNLLLIIAHRYIDNKRNYLVHDRHYNRLFGNYIMKNVDEKLIEAKYEDGVLYISAPLRKESNEKKTIEIK